MKFRRHAIAMFLIAPIAIPLQAQTPCSAPWRLEQTLRLGSISGSDALTFPVAMELDRNGRIYLAQALQPFVSVFTLDGRLERTIGRAGEGPGEISFSIFDLGRRGDTLWVRDTRRILFFREDGRFIRDVAFRTQVPTEGSLFTPGVPLGDGTFLGARNRIGPLPEYAIRQKQLPIRRFSPAGDVLGNLAFTNWSDRYVAVPSARGVAHHEHIMTHDLNVGPGESNPSGVATRDGTAVLLIGEVRINSAGATFDLLKVALSGDTILRRAVPFQPRAVTQAEADGLREIFSGWVAGDFFRPAQPRPNTPQRDQTRRAAAAAITFPQFHPPVRRVVAGHDGSIWILREFRLAATGTWIDRWDIYDADGRLQGGVEIREGKSDPITPFAPRLHVLRATMDELWGVTTDDLDVPYLHRYKVHRTCQE